MVAETSEHLSPTPEQVVVDRLDEFCLQNKHLELGAHVIEVPALSPDLNAHRERSPIQAAINKMRHRAGRKGFNVRSETTLTSDKNNRGLKALRIDINVLKK
jgi:hypothetical protein